MDSSPNSPTAREKLIDKLDKYRLSKRKIRLQLSHLISAYDKTKLQVLEDEYNYRIKKGLMTWEEWWEWKKLQILQQRMEKEKYKQAMKSFLLFSIGVDRYLPEIHQQAHHQYFASYRGDSSHPQNPDERNWAYRLFEDSGSAFSLGYVGGSLWFGYKGFRSSPWGIRLRSAFAAARARAIPVGMTFGLWGFCFGFGEFFARTHGFTFVGPFGGLLGGALAGFVLSLRERGANLAMGAFHGALFIAVLDIVSWYSNTSGLAKGPSFHSMVMDYAETIFEDLSNDTIPVNLKIPGQIDSFKDINDSLQRQNKETDHSSLVDEPIKQRNPQLQKHQLLHQQHPTDVEHSHKKQQQTQPQQFTKEEQEEIRRILKQQSEKYGIDDEEEEEEENQSFISRLFERKEKLKVKQLHLSDMIDRLDVNQSIGDEPEKPSFTEELLQLFNDQEEEELGLEYDEEEEREKTLAEKIRSFNFSRYLNDMEYYGDPRGPLRHIEFYAGIQKNRKKYREILIEAYEIQRKNGTVDPPVVDSEKLEHGIPNVFPPLHERVPRSWANRGLIENPVDPPEKPISPWTYELDVAQKPLEPELERLLMPYPKFREQLLKEQRAKREKEREEREHYRKRYVDEKINFIRAFRTPQSYLESTRLGEYFNGHHWVLTVPPPRSKAINRPKDDLLLWRKTPDLRHLYPEPDEFLAKIDITYNSLPPSSEPVPPFQPNTTSNDYFDKKIKKMYSEDPSQQSQKRED